jgi:hypothetical protein
VYLPMVLFHAPLQWAILATLGPTISITASTPNVPVRIVGVVADAVSLSLRESPQPTIYLPLEQRNEPSPAWRLYGRAGSRRTPG